MNEQYTMSKQQIEYLQDVLYSCGLAAAHHNVKLLDYDKIVKSFEIIEQVMDKQRLNQIKITLNQLQQAIAVVSKEE